jgi:hypothetical protein
MFISILSAHYYKVYIVICVEHSNMAKGHFHASVARQARNFLLIKSEMLGLMANTRIATQYINSNSCSA